MELDRYRRNRVAHLRGGVGADQVRFFVDDRLVRTVDQDINYQMQLMLDLFEFRADETLDTSYPKEWAVDGAGPPVGHLRFVFFRVPDSPF